MFDRLTSEFQSSRAGRNDRCVAALDLESAEVLQIIRGLL
jgi:hypothetical protein